MFLQQQQFDVWVELRLRIDDVCRYDVFRLFVTCWKLETANVSIQPRNTRLNTHKLVENTQQRYRPSCQAKPEELPVLRYWFNQRRITSSERNIKLESCNMMKWYGKWSIINFVPSKRRLGRRIRIKYNFVVIHILSPAYVIEHHVH